MNTQFFNRMNDLQNEMMVMQNQILPFIKKFVDSKVKPETQRCAPIIRQVLIVNGDIEVTTFECDVWGDEGEFTYKVNIQYFIKTFCK